MDELFVDLPGCIFFRKIDCITSFLQLSTDEETAKLLTISTDKGLYKCNRLMFGVAAAPLIWQNVIEKILCGISNTKVLMDDIRFGAKTFKEYIPILEEICKRLHEHNVRINLAKSDLFTDRITYCGHVIDKDGIYKNETKFEAITKLPRPINVSEVRSFIGGITFYSRFIDNLSKVLQPLHELLEINAKFLWTDRHEKAWKKAKELFVSNVR